MIQKFHDESRRSKWHCCHCHGEWYEYNVTKALGHVTGIVKDIKACSGMIGSCYKESYLDPQTKPRAAAANTDLKCLLLLTLLIVTVMTMMEI